MSATIHSKLTRGAAWMILFKLSERSLGLLSTLVLVRVLTPVDFGVVAMAMSFIAVAELITSFGFDLALIQNQNSDERHYHVAWTCNLLLGCAVMLTMFVSAEPIARFYNRPDVFWVVCALGVGPAIAGAENIGVVAFRKDLDFKKEFRFLLAKKVVAVAITIPLALALRSYWALVAGTLFSRAAGTLFSYLIHPFRPRLSFAHMSDLLTFSRWILANNIIMTLKERATDFIIGSLQGPRALGLYNIANEFANLPHSELAAPANRALIPSFAKVQGDRAGVHDAFLRAVSLLAFIVVPTAALIHCIAPYLVPLLFGAKWLEAIPLMQILALAGGTIALHSPLCALLVSHGHPGRVGVSHISYVAVLFAGMFVFVPRWGATGAALAVLGAAILSSPIYLYQVRHCIGIPMRSVVAAMSRPLLAAAVMVGAVRVVSPWVGPIDGLIDNIVLLIAFGAGSAAVYLVTLLVSWHLVGRPAGAETAVLDRLASLWRRRQ